MRLALAGSTTLKPTFASPLISASKPASRTWKLTSALALLFAGLCLALPTSSQSSDLLSERGVWRTAAPAPTKRTEVIVVALRDKIYVMGGFEQLGFSNLMNLSITPLVEVYDPATDRWTTKDSMPVGLHHAGVAVAGGRIYVIGGYMQAGLNVWHPVATVYAYDPETDAWNERAPMPTPRGALSQSWAGSCMPSAARPDGQ